MVRVTIVVARIPLLARAALLLLISPLAALPQAVVNSPVHFDVSPPLLSLPRVAPSGSGTFSTMPLFFANLEALNNMGQPRPSGGELGGFGSDIHATVGIDFGGAGNAPTSVANCGRATGFFYVPSDDNMAVGDTQIVQWVNTCYAVFDKATGNLIAGPFAGNQFWAGFGTACETENSGDPIIQWDKSHHRWVAAQNTFRQPSNLACIAVSQTSDATGGYNRYAFPQPGFPDYPKWGLTPDIYYQTQNVFLSTANPVYLGVNVCAYDGSAMRAGSAAAEQICIFDNDTFDASLLPADNDFNHEDYEDWDKNAPQHEVLLGSINNFNPGTAVYEYVFTADFANRTATLAGTGGTMPLAVPPYFLACGGFAACIPQPTPGELLDSLGDRLMYRLAHFNNDQQEYWLVTHSVMDLAAVAARWYQFTAPKGSTNLALAQSGNTANDLEFRWMGSVAMNKVRDIALGYSRSSAVPGDYPSIYFAGQTAGDPAGTTEGEALIYQGGGSQVNSFNRWGDYTAMVLDHEDGCTFWYTNQFYPQTASFLWDTRIASLKFGNCREEDDIEGTDSEGADVKAHDDVSHPERSGLSYQDPLVGVNLQSTSAQSVLYNGSCVSFVGNATVNALPGFAYTFTGCSSSSGSVIGTYSINITGLPLPYQKTDIPLVSGSVSIYPH